VKSETWGIVGGGFLGMTLALRLAQQGHKVVLHEAAPTLGGLASAWKLGDIVWDRHYHVTLGSDSYLRGILKELDLEQELQWVQTMTGFYADAKFYSMSNTWEFLQFPPLNLIEKFRLGITISYGSRVKNWRRLSSITAVDWLTKLSGRRTVEKIWLPLLRAKLGDSCEKVSAAFIWATISRMYAARRSGLKKETFGYVPGGYGRIFDRFAEHLTKLGVTIKVAQSVTSIEQGPNDKLAIRFADHTTSMFDRVVVTTPAPIAAQVCPQLLESEKERLRALRYMGVICPSVLLKKPLKGFYVTNIIDSWVPFTAVIEMSALVDRAQFGGKSLIYLPKYLASDSPEFQTSDEDIRQRFVQALSRMYPDFQASDVLSFQISRARLVMPVQSVNYTEHIPDVTTSIPGLFIVNSSQIMNGTLNINETVQLAENSLKHLLGAATTVASPSLESYVQDKAYSQPLIGSR
jgi:protoporphyrinogen oxidase